MVNNDKNKNIKRRVLTEPEINGLKENFPSFENFFNWIMIKGDAEEEIFYSASVKDITGYSSDEIVSLPGKGYSLIDKTEAAKIKKRFADFESSDEVHLTLDYKIMKKDGVHCWLQEVIKKNVKPEHTIYYGIVTDITSLKEKEETLKKRTNELSELNSAKDNFISILSHDLRAPFTSILGFSEILMNENSLSEQERSEYLNYIHGSSENQLHLINYLLDWSRLQTGRMKMEMQRVHVPLIIFNCVSSLTGSAIRKNMEIKTHVDDSIYVEADERLLSQVVTNLLSNAIKFSDSGGYIEIRAGIFNDDFIEFIIKDKGIGIPEDVKDKLFRFDKMYSTNGTRGEKGAGLGLPLVKAIIEKHGGEIWFYSDKSGTEFHFTMPSAASSVLLIDHDLEDRLLLENLIRDKFPTLRVIGSDNGYDAINIFFDHHPALIISSHQLPLMDGYQMINSIRKKDKNFSTPVIILSDNLSEKIIKTYRDIGIKDIVEKPVDLRILSEKLSSLLN